jgi:hypothetical protein
MQSCCEPYSKKFDNKVAESELADYRKGIFKKNSQLLIRALTKLIPAGAEVMDIGGGLPAFAERKNH